MRPFEIYSAGILIGHSELERGDAPMGVASGRLIPLPAFEEIRKFVVIDLRRQEMPSQKHLKLTIREAAGSEIASSGGVQIMDCCAELGPEGLIVEILGVPYPLYEELFPRHVEAYRQHWKRK